VFAVELCHAVFYLAPTGCVFADMQNFLVIHFVNLIYIYIVTRIIAHLIVLAFCECQVVAGVSLLLTTCRYLYKRREIISKASETWK
jgi:hypothetical protein